MCAAQPLRCVHRLGSETVVVSQWLSKAALALGSQHSSELNPRHPPTPVPKSSRSIAHGLQLQAVLCCCRWLKLFAQHCSGVMHHIKGPAARNSWGCAVVPPLFRVPESLPRMCCVCM
jgi:hypothetical protein